MSHDEFVTQYVLNRALAAHDELSGVGAAREAEKTWEAMQKTATRNKVPLGDSPTPIPAPGVTTPAPEVVHCCLAEDAVGQRCTLPVGHEDRHLSALGLRFGYGPNTTCGVCRFMDEDPVDEPCRSCDIYARSNFEPKDSRVKTNTACKECANWIMNSLDEPCKSCKVSVPTNFQRKENK